MKTYAPHPLSKLYYHIQTHGTPCTPEEVERIEHAHRPNAVLTPDMTKLFEECADFPDLAVIVMQYVCSVSRDGLDAARPELPEHLQSAQMFLDEAQRLALLERRSSIARTGRKPKSANQAPTDTTDAAPAKADTKPQISPTTARFTSINIDSFLIDGMERAAAISTSAERSDRIRATYCETVLSYLLNGDDGTLHQRTTAPVLQERAGLSVLQATQLAYLIGRGIAHADSIRHARASGKNGRSAIMKGKHMATTPAGTVSGTVPDTAPGITPGAALLIAAGIPLTQDPRRATPEQLDSLMAVVEAQEAERKKRKETERQAKRNTAAGPA